MMMNLMMILVKKVFISSKPTFVYLLCPPLCGPFSIQESAAGGLSYKAKKELAKQALFMPVTGLEPVRGCPRGILSPLRLPIPPHRQTYKYVDDGFPSNGTYRARTYDPLLVRQMLSQLS